LSAEGVGNLDSYSDREKANWSGSKRIVLYDSPAQLKQFVENARAKNNLDKKMYFGKIPADIAAGIEAETGVNITGNNLSLSAMEIRKIIAKHGDNATENKRGQRSIVLDDFAAIPSIVTEYDKVTLAGTHNGRPVLLFEKEINGKTTAVTYTSERSRDLIVQTMYSGKSKSSIARAATGEPAASTSETTSGTTALSDTSISPSAENVNSKISAEAGVNDGNVNSKYSLSETENGGAAEAELEEGVPAFITRQRDAVRAAYNQADAKAKAKGMGVRASRASAKGIKEDLHSTLSLTKMHEGLRDAVTAYQKGKDLSFEALYNSLTPLAWEIAHSAEVEITYTDGSGTDWVNPYYGDMDNSVRMITNALAAHLADAKPVYDKTLEAVRDWAQRRAAGVERANELIRKYNSGRADTIKPSGRENFEAPEHIGGMGIKIDGSNGEYSGVDTLIKNEDAYKRYDTFVKAEIKRLKPSDEDIRIARQLANGDIDITSISDIKDKRRLTDFADMFATQNALASGLIAERRRAVARYEDTGSDYFLEGVTEVKQAGKLTMNLLTPERLVKRAFGERAGTRIYEHFFAPVQANESERLRYAGELLDQLREFEGSDGKVRALNDAESDAVFTMLEAENIEERIDREYLSDYIRQLADQLIEDAGVNAERIVRDYSFIRPNSQWKTAERLNTKQIALAQNYAQMKVLEKEFSAGTVDKTRVENSVKVLCSHYVSRDQPRSRGEQSKVGSQCRR
jgi:hypothetical protein